MKTGSNLSNRKRRSATDTPPTTVDNKATTSAAADKKDALNMLKVASEEMVSPGGKNFQSQTQKIIDNLKSDSISPYPTFMKTSKGRATTEFES